MNEVIVHRCVLRIRRTAGWMWGASPDALLDAAARALPALIAARLPAIAATAMRPVHVTVPVRVRVEATIAELAALATQSGASDAVASSSAALGQRVGAALEAALRPQLEAATPDPEVPALEDDAEPGTPAPGKDAIGEGAVRRALRAWATSGAIERVLARLEARAIVALHDAALPEAEAPAHVVGPSRALDEGAGGGQGGPTELVRSEPRRIGPAAAEPVSPDDAAAPDREIAMQRASARRALRAWAATGAIERMLGGFDDPAIAALHASMLAEPDASPAGIVPRDGSISLGPSAADRMLGGLDASAITAFHALYASVLAEPDASPAGAAPRDGSISRGSSAADRSATTASATALDVLRARIALAATIVQCDPTVSARTLRAAVDASLPAPPRDEIRAAIARVAAIDPPVTRSDEPAPASAPRAGVAATAPGMAKPSIPRSGETTAAPSPLGGAAPMTGVGATVADTRSPASVALANTVATDPSATRSDDDASARASAGGVSSIVTEPRLRITPPRGNAEVEIRSVLPFLLLPALHHAGWLDTATTLLEAHELTGASFALAAALAGKLLDPPEHGWMRSRDDRAIIAAFAGTDEPIAGNQLTAAASRLAPVLGVLDDSLRAVLGSARRRGLPAILWRGACGWSVLDADGLAVLASGPAIPAVLASLGGALAEILLAVPASCADPATLDRIDLANLRFVTDAPPTRSEVWRAIAGGGRPLWTNDTATPPGKLAATVSDFEALVALAAELTGELDARPAIARAPLPALEATATLAVTAALADLSARLFSTEPATPILAMSRFRDLDARVRFEPDCLRVRVPLGRRHADLMRHGLLTTIPRVPWLGGRCVDLGGA